MNDLKTTFYSNVTFLFLIKLLVGCICVCVKFPINQRTFGEIGALEWRKQVTGRCLASGQRTKSNSRWHCGDARGNALIIIDYKGKHELYRVSQQSSPLINSQRWC